MKLFFRQLGEGKPVVILHGLLGLSDNWITFARQLASDFKVYIPDLRNHGQSPHDPVFNYNVLVEDLLELIKDQGLKNVDLIGHSLGGKMAMLFALTYPDYLDKLVVVDIASKKYPPFGDHLMLINAMLHVDLSSAHARSDIDRQLEQNVKSLKLRQFLLKNVYWKDKETLGWRLNLPVLKESLPEILKAVDSPNKFEKPVLLVKGGLSDYIQESDLPEMKKKFPRISVKTLGNASHWVHADAPGEFYSLVHEFLVS